VHPYNRHLADLEREQHGLIRLDQLTHNPAWTKARVDHRLRAQRHRVSRGVYANPSVRATYEQLVLAALLAGGRGAFTSHETAAKLLEMPLPGPALLEVSTSLERRPIVRGARMHRSGLVTPEDIIEVQGIRVSSPELTIASLSSRHSLNALGRMADDAVRRRIMTLDALAAIVERLPPAPGRSRKKMRVVLDRRLPGVEEHESDLEDFVVAAIHRFQLPPPVAQHPVTFKGQQRRIDLCYPDDWLTLEAKGF
jgi:hypothetical protein